MCLENKLNIPTLWINLKPLSKFNTDLPDFIDYYYEAQTKLAKLRATNSNTIALEIAGTNSFQDAILVSTYLVEKLKWYLADIMLNDVPNKPKIALSNYITNTPPKLTQINISYAEKVYHYKESMGTYIAELKKQIAYKQRKFNETQLTIRAEGLACKPVSIAAYILTKPHKSNKFQIGITNINIGKVGPWDNPLAQLTLQLDTSKPGYLPPLIYNYNKQFKQTHKP